MKTLINGLKINYLIKGEGKPILLLEGWKASLKTYEKLIDHLSEYRKVYALDLPGFGESDEPKTSMSLNDYLFIVLEFIKKYELNNFDIIAHSFGGRIVIKSFPNDLKINKLILISPAGIQNKKSFSKIIKQHLYKIIKKVPKLKEYYINKFSSLDYKNLSEVMRKTLVKVVNEDLKYKLPDIDRPCLLIWGENDKETPLKNGYIMKESIPDSGLCIIPDTGHFCFLEKEDYVYKIIDSFLKEQE